MTAQIDEIADGIYRISTFVPEVGPDGFTFNQFLIDDEQPLLFHTGMPRPLPAGGGGDRRRSCRCRAAAVDHVRPRRGRRVRGHEQLPGRRARRPGRPTARSAATSRSTTWPTGRPRPLADGEVIELGRHRVRHIDTPHVPHGWEAPGPVRGDDRHPAVRRPLLAARRRARGHRPRRRRGRRRRPRTSSAPAASPRAPGPPSGRWPSWRPPRWRSCTARASQATAPRPSGAWPTTTTGGSPRRAEPDRHDLGRVGRFRRTSSSAPSLNRDPPMLIRLLRTYLRAYRRPLAAVLALQAVQAIANLYLPTLNADLIDNGVLTGDRATSGTSAGACWRSPCCSWCAPRGPSTSAPRRPWGSAATCGPASSTPSPATRRGRWASSAPRRSSPGSPTT